MSPATCWLTIEDLRQIKFLHPAQCQQCFLNGIAYRRGDRYDVQLYAKPVYLGKNLYRLTFSYLIWKIFWHRKSGWFHAARELIDTDDVKMGLLNYFGVSGATLRDYYFMWATLFRKYSRASFLEIAGNVFGQIWPLIQIQLAASGFDIALTEFDIAKAKDRSLKYFLELWPDSIYPALPLRISEDDWLKLTWSTVTEGPHRRNFSRRHLPSVPDIDYWTLDSKTKFELKNHLICALRRWIYEGEGYKWDRPSVDGQEHSSVMQLWEMNSLAWGADAILHQATRESYSSVGLPLGFIEPAALTANSNAIQSDLMRLKGFSWNGDDHDGGGMFEAEAGISYEVHKAAGTLHLWYQWLDRTTLPFLRPLAIAYRSFPFPSHMNRQPFSVRTNTYQRK